MNTRFKSGAICALTMSCVGFINTHALSQTATVHVNADSEAVSPDGSSWSEAFPFLQDGLTKASDLLAGDPAPETVEIWVAQGTYQTDQLFGFEIPSNVRLFGGFEGTEADRYDRSLDPATTILTDDGITFPAFIVSMFGTNDTARLDGFTIAPATSDIGIWLDQSSGIVSNCVITNSGTAITGFATSGFPFVQVINCRLTGNDRAINVNGTKMRLVNCLIDNNGTGSTIIVEPSGSLEAFNCTIADNVLSNYNTSAIRVFGDLFLKNSIVWGNARSQGQVPEDAQISVGSGGTADVQSSCIHNLNDFEGNGNIGNDPLFVDSSSEDFRLRASSPAVNTGSLASPTIPLDELDIDQDNDTSEFTPDLDFSPRVEFTEIDMGAYEFRDCEASDPTDCNGNGIPDECELADNPDLDCDGNGILDECDIANDPSLDCNNNGILNVCEIECGGTIVCQDDCSAQVVFILDTSASMAGELDQICAAVIEPFIDFIENDLGFDLELQILMLAGASASWSCANETWPSVNEFFSGGQPTPVPVHDSVDSYDCLTVLPNSPSQGAAGEAWATATSIVAYEHSWPAEYRLIIPISDEAPCQGSVSCDSADDSSIANAIAWANEMGIDVFPITGQGTPSCVKSHANDLAQNTTAVNALHHDDYQDYNLVGEGLIDTYEELSSPCLICCDPGDCPPDLNDDGVVDGADLLILLSQWGQCADPTPGNCPADLTCDGVVDGADLLILMGSWGQFCTTGVHEIAPQTIEDCYERYEEDTNEFLACVFAVEEIQSMQDPD